MLVDRGPHTIDQFFFSLRVSSNFTESSRTIQILTQREKLRPLLSHLTRLNDGFEKSDWKFYRFTCVTFHSRGIIFLAPLSLSSK